MAGTSDRPGVAVLGLGNMGGRMAARLLECGLRTTVYNRSAARAAALGDAGAQVAASAAAAVDGADVVLVSLSDEAATRAVVLGDAFRALGEGTSVIGASTVSPAFSAELADRLRAAGVRYVETCVLGKPALAGSGGLRLFTAGECEPPPAVRTVLDALAAQVRHVGGTGQAAAMKLAFNQLIGAQTASLAEAVAFGERAGLDREMLLTAIANSGFSSAVMKFRATLARELRYTPAAFSSSLMLKDLRLAIEGARLGGVAMPVTEQVAACYAEVVARGLGDHDAAVMCEVARDRTAGPAAPTSQEPTRGGRP